MSLECAFLVQERQPRIARLGERIALQRTKELRGDAGGVEQCDRHRIRRRRFLATSSRRSGGNVALQVAVLGGSARWGQGLKLEPSFAPRAAPRIAEVLGEPLSIQPGLPGKKGPLRGAPRSGAKTRSHGENRRVEDLPPSEKRMTQSELTGPPSPGHFASFEADSEIGALLARKTRRQLPWRDKAADIHDQTVRFRLAS